MHNLTAHVLVSDISLPKSIRSMITKSIETRQIDAETKDNAFLLTFITQLNKVKTRRQLSKIINQHLKDHLNFDYSALFVLNSNRDAVKNYLCDDEFVNPDNPFYDHRTVDKFSAGGLAFYFALQSATETSVDFDEVSATHDISPYLKTQVPAYDGTVLNLCYGDMVFAHWALVNTIDHASYKRNEYLQVIANLLSLTLINLISLELISEKDAESGILQSLNIDFASVRDKNDLLKIIQYKLKKLFEFGHQWVAVINEDQMTMSFFLQDSVSEVEEHPCYQDAIKARYTTNDRIFNKVLLSKEPHVFDLEQLSQRGSMPEYMQILYESGVKKIIMIGLQVGSRIIGVWAVCLTEQQQLSQKHLSLIKSISNQLSIAVHNIITNEAVAEEEQGKSRLLAFSNIIASVREKNVLAKILKQQLKDLFNITDYVIHFLSDDKQKYTPILFDPDANFAQCTDFKKLVNNQNDVNDGIFDKILASEDPVFFNIDKCFSQPGCPDYLKSARAINLQQMIGISIRLGLENIAVMTFIHDDYDRILERYHLFKCILSQIALSISNIVTNEKVMCQLTEINNYKFQLEEEKIYLKEEIETTLNYTEMIGESAVMQKTFRLVAQVAPSDSTVLILGETGTGKELIARAIHNSSSRKNKLMVKVNCAALPANLIESELFGHERGSFTGATERRLGKFELANNGTLFLDEIGEMPLDLQVKLLRALQEREIERVGGRNTIKVNVRIIAATNRDLEKEMAEGRFRSDLYYRLNIFPITLPALRDRKDDIPDLALYFIQRFGKKCGKHITTLHSRVLQQLVSYHWPGNIRELEHLIERSILLNNGNSIEQIHLPNQYKPVMPKAIEEEFITKTIDENERDFILKTLKYCNGKIGGQHGAAKLLGVPASTLNSKIKRLGIRRDHHV